MPPGAASTCPTSVRISIETTPKIAAQQPEKMRAYHDMGIRRISMGIQTINPRLLSEMGRDSTSLSFNRKAAEAVRAAGFERFNVDVMYGFANQSLAIAGSHPAPRHQPATRVRHPLPRALQGHAHRGTGRRGDPRRGQ